MTNEEKLQNFRTMTMEAVRKKAADEQADYQAALDRSFEEYKKNRNGQMVNILGEEKEKLRRDNNKKISLEQIRIRHEYSQRYEELKAMIKAEVLDKLAEFMETKEYEELLIGQIRKALAFAKGEAVTIYIDPADRSLKEALEEASGVTLTVSEYSFGGGTRAVLPEKNVLIDESYETRIKEIMDQKSFLGGKSCWKII